MEYFGTNQWLWGVLVLGALLLEVFALKNKERGDTWSEVLRYVFGFSKRQTDAGWKRRVRQTIFWAIWIWFAVHIALGW